METTSTSLNVNTSVHRNGNDDLAVFASFLERHETLQTAHEVLRNESADLQSKQEALQHNYEDLKGRHSTLEGDYKTLQRKYQDLQDDYRGLQSEMKTLRQQYNVQCADTQELQKRNAEIRDEYKEMKSGIAQLLSNQTNQSMQSSNSGLVLSGIQQLLGQILHSVHSLPNQLSPTHTRLYSNRSLGSPSVQSYTPLQTPKFSPSTRPNSMFPSTNPVDSKRTRQDDGSYKTGLDAGSKRFCRDTGEHRRDIDSSGASTRRYAQEGTQLSHGVNVRTPENPLERHDEATLGNRNRESLSSDNYQLPTEFYSPVRSGMSCSSHTEVRIQQGERRIPPQIIPSTGTRGERELNIAETPSALSITSSSIEPTMRPPVERGDQFQTFKERGLDRQLEEASLEIPRLSHLTPPSPPSRPSGQDITSSRPRKSGEKVSNLHGLLVVEDSSDEDEDEPELRREEPNSKGVNTINATTPEEPNWTDRVNDKVSGKYLSLPDVCADNANSEEGHRAADSTRRNSDSIYLSDSSESRQETNCSFRAPTDIDSDAEAITALSPPKLTMKSSNNKTALDTKKPRFRGKLRDPLRELHGYCLPQAYNELRGWNGIQGRDKIPSKLLRFTDEGMKQVLASVQLMPNLYRRTSILPSAGLTDMWYVFDKSVNPLMLCIPGRHLLGLVGISPQDIEIKIGRAKPLFMRHDDGSHSYLGHFTIYERHLVTDEEWDRFVTGSIVDHWARKFHRVCASTGSTRPYERNEAMKMEIIRHLLESRPKSDALSALQRPERITEGQEWNQKYGVKIRSYTVKDFANAFKAPKSGPQPSLSLYWQKFRCRRFDLEFYNKLCEVVKTHEVEKDVLEFSEEDDDKVFFESDSELDAESDGDLRKKPGDESEPELDAETDGDLRKKSGDESDEETEAAPESSVDPSVSSSPVETDE